MHCAGENAIAFGEARELHFDVDGVVARQRVVVHRRPACNGVAWQCRCLIVSIGVE